MEVFLTARLQTSLRVFPIIFSVHKSVGICYTDFTDRIRVYDKGALYMDIKIITVSRQFGSGGRIIAKDVADKLGWKFYDREIIEKIAEKSGLA